MILITVIMLCLIENVIKANVRFSYETNSRKMDFVFITNRIVPDVIDTVPQNLIQVKFPSGVQVNLGNELTPTSVKDEPSVEWPVEEGAYYTLIMSDPDAPSRKDPSFAEFKHWLVVNIPGSQISKGETLAAYISSGPPKDSGLHRYVFLVFKQSAIIAHSETPVGNRSRRGRRNFKIRDFAKKHNLWEPIAGNFYQAQYDDYVPIWGSQFTKN